MNMTDPLATHEVLNQTPPLADINLFTGDRVLVDAVTREGGGDWLPTLDDFGAFAGSRAARELGRLANEFPPRLTTHDPQGNRIDRVEFHPAYHELMSRTIGAGAACLSSARLAQETPSAGANVARAALLAMAYQAEPGHCCPVTMTNASLAALRHQPDLLECWLPRVMSRVYEPQLGPFSEKSGVTVGMGMTEKQGGTDVRANTTRAEPASTEEDGAYRITGHKWFMSAPMSDGFLILAQAPGGLTCFLLPRVLPDGAMNPIRIQRLKDKLGDRANASAEVEFHGCMARRVGEEGRGVATIIAMVNHTRLDCAVASAALMRWGVLQAVHHARHRTVFQKRLVDQPMMRQVLAALAVEQEAAMALSMRLARAFDWHETDERESAFMRLMTPVVKYWTCKIAPAFTAEAMECLGGNGYVEEGVMARAFRQSPLNAIWEGSGNVMALDVLRVADKAPNVLAIVVDEIGRMASGDRELVTALDKWREMALDLAGSEASLRLVVERLAQLAAAAILRDSGDQAVADAFIGCRVRGGGGQTYGAGPVIGDADHIIERLQAG